MLLSGELQFVLPCSSRYPGINTRPGTGTRTSVFCLLMLGECVQHPEHSESHVVDVCSILLWLLLAEPDRYLQKAAEILTDYIIELRTFVKNYPRSQVNITDVGSDSDEDLPAVEESQMWEKLTPEVKANNGVLTILIKNIQGSD